MADPVRSILLPGLVLTAAVGVGIALLGPRYAPGLAASVRPVAKKALRSALLLVERAEESISELGEMAEDLYAEVKHDITMDRMQQMAAEQAAREAEEA